MSTLAIAPKRVRLYRVLWDRWIIVLRILFDLGAMNHPVRWKDVADTLLVDKNTCKKYIHGLIREGHIVDVGEGRYMFTQSGMDVLLENTGGEFFTEGVKDSPQIGESFTGGGESLTQTGGKLFLEEEENTPDMGVRNSLLVKLSSSSSSSSSFELKDLTTTTTQLGIFPGEIFSPDVRLILQKVPLLFDGDEVSKKGLPTYLHVEKVLGWISYTYDKRETLHSPCGFIHSKLTDPKQPMPYIKYMKSPEKFLPDDYLDAIGRYEKTCERCQEIFTQKSDFDQHLETCISTSIEEGDDDHPDGLEPDKTVLVSMPGMKMNAQQVWESVKGQLGMEMPRASFDTWVRDTQAVHFENSVLQVGVLNAYACDWLANRLESTVNRLVIGIANAEVKVIFVNMRERSLDK